MSNLKSDVILRRIVAIKYLYSIGVEQSKQIGSFAGFSILSFHDCVEMLLVLIAEKKKEKPQQHFLEYWKIIPQLPYKELMDNLNIVRKNFKHYANFPDKEEIQRCCIDVGLFLKDSVKQFFEYEFDEISLASLIKFDEVKGDVEKAERLMKDELFFDSLYYCKLAFMKLLATYDSNKGQWRDSILNVGCKIGSEYRRLVKNNNEGSVWFEQMTKTTNSVRDVLKITALGIDYKRYALFNFITPCVKKSYDATGTIYISEKREAFEIEKKIRKEDCQFCVFFVVDCALKLQEFDYDISSYLKGRN